MRGLDKDGKIRFVDVSREDGAGPADRETLLRRFHVVEDGELKSGAEAFAAMWRTIPSLAPLGRFARRPRVLRALEAAYRLFLRARPSLQRLVRRWDKGRQPS